MQDHRIEKLCKLLSEELSFLELGGYGRAFRSQWRPTLIFRDSPLCLNFDYSAPPQPCERCPLFQFVPEEKRQTFTPCHHIPLNAEGDTPASLYRSGTQEQLDVAVRKWLQDTIDKLREEEKQP